MNIIEKVQFLLKLNALWSKIKKLKGGGMEKKSELKLTIVAEVLLIVGTLVKFIPAETAAVIGGSLAGIYTLARAIVKATKNKKDDEVLAELENKVEMIIDALNSKKK